MSDKQPLSPDQIDPYDYEATGGWFARLLWYSAGADAQLLMRSPESDRVKYQGIGGVVLTTGVLAFISGSYAFYSVFGPRSESAIASEPLDRRALWMALAAGAVWAAIIYNLDRLIVSSTGKGDGTERLTLKELAGALPRILMAILFAIVLSAPLELRILKPEIDSALAGEQKEYERQLNEKSELVFEGQKRELLAKRDGAQARLDQRPVEFEKRRQEILKQRQALEMEAEGLSGSRKAGRGPAWQDKSSNLDRMQKELDEWKAAVAAQDEPIRQDIARYVRDLEDIDSRLKATREQNSHRAAHLDGLLKRIEISHKIGGMVPWMIALLLLAIECGPILFKLMMSTGAYEYLSENQKRLAQARWGVEPREIPSRDGKTMQITARYHAAEALGTAEKARHQAEIALVKHQYEVFVDEEKKRMGEVSPRPAADGDGEADAG
ncbi:MAG: DUF4407 domain-containing protein [Alphaproteobacteria bacterium]